MEEIKFTKETIEAFLQEKMKSGNKPETIAEYRRILQKFQKELLPEEVLRENTLQQWSRKENWRCAPSTADWRW